MDMLINLVNILASDTTGMVYIGIGLMAIGMAVLAGLGTGIGEGLVCAKTVESMGRNPDMYGKLRTAMILGCALTETTAIYSLLVALLMLFIG